MSRFEDREYIAVCGVGEIQLAREALSMMSDLMREWYGRSLYPKTN